jgi:hypothetical protein
MEHTNRSQNNDAGNSDGAGIPDEVEIVELYRQIDQLKESNRRLEELARTYQQPTNQGYASLPPMDSDEMVAFGLNLGRMQADLPWAWADWGNAWKSRSYGDLKAITETPEWKANHCPPYSRLATYISVGKKIPFERRRRVGYTHHATVASLKPAQIDALLDRAEREDMSVADLKTEAAQLRKPRKTKTKKESDPESALVDPLNKLKGLRDELVVTITDVAESKLPAELRQEARKYLADIEHQAAAGAGDIWSTEDDRRAKRLAQGT